jgi:hypothetical protein
MADWQEDQTNGWLAQNAWCRAPDYVVGYYGSFQDHDLSGFSEFMLADDLMVHPELTFVELLDELSTRPLYDGTCKIQYLPAHLNDRVHGEWLHDLNGNPLTGFETYVWDTFGWDRANWRARLGSLADMKVDEWRDELVGLCSWENIGSSETWT